jgi:hypothetical protein
MLSETYKKYSTLPNLRKISADDVFERNVSESPRLREEKEEALANQRVFFEHENDPVFYDIYPRKLASTSYLDIAREAEEDFLIHRIKDDRDWLSSAHVCFASHWLPEDKIGKSLEEIHRPVPMNLKNSRKLAEAAARSGIFERFVWSVVHDDRYNFHPRLPHSRFERENPKVLVKVERQVTVAFPDHDFCLFVLRQYLIPEERLDKPALANSIRNMKPEEKAYKGLSDCADLLEYLDPSSILGD